MPAYLTKRQKPKTKEGWAFREVVNSYPNAIYVLDHDTGSHLITSFYSCDYTSSFSCGSRLGLYSRCQRLDFLSEAIQDRDVGPGPPKRTRRVRIKDQDWSIICSRSKHQPAHGKEYLVLKIPIPGRKPAE
jgi:hypothetical protein